jgi:transposase
MFLKCNSRFKNGKDHHYWSIVENRRCAGGRIVQRPVLYLGEINDSQKEAWIKSIEVFDEDQKCAVQLTLFRADGLVPAHVTEAVQVRLERFELHRPRQWGACWLACDLWSQLQLDRFWDRRLPASREGTQWKLILQTLVCYGLIDPGSEWRLHRQWFEQSAMADLLGRDFALVEKDNLYRCLDRLLKHKQALFGHLRQRWADLFGAQFDVLLYDLTSTYFESDPPDSDSGSKKRFGYSRDKRSDCVQVVIALIVTPEGFPIAYEVMPGNTSDKSTLKDFLERIQTQYGRARRTWLMDRGIPTEEALQQMREQQIGYLVGTPKGRLSALEAQLVQEPWHQARAQVRVKLLPQESANPVKEDTELYVYVESQDRVSKERSMRRRRLRKLWKRLQELRAMKPSRDELLMKLGAARKDAGRAWHLVQIQTPKPRQAVTPETFRFQLNRDKLRIVRRQEGRYLLRSNLSETDPAQLWLMYLLLAEIEATFKSLKGDLHLRPIFHKKESRIESHIFLAFMAYCLQVTLKARLRGLAPGLTPRAVLDKMAALQMVDVHFPTTDGRELIFSRYTQPEKDQQLLLLQLKLQLPEQAPPRITTQGKLIRNN